MEEIWKDVKGYEGLYQVSSEGRVKSLSRDWATGKGCLRHHDDIIMTPQLRLGYYRVRLVKDGAGRAYSVHRLVAEAFLPNTNNKPIVDHINGIATDNRSCNLRWCTQGENNRFELHRQNLRNAMIGRKFSEEARRNIAISQYKRVDQINPTTGEVVASYASLKEAAKLTKTNYTSLSNCCKGKCKTSNGYIWRIEKDET